MKFLANMKIGKRLSLGFAVLLALSIMVTGIGIWRLQAVAEATSAMMAQPLAKERLVSDWYRNIASGVRRTTAIAKSSDSSLATFFEKDQTAATASSSKLQKAIEALLTMDKEKALFNKIGETRKTYIASRDAIWQTKKDGQTDESTRILDQTFIPASLNYQSQIEAMLDMQRQTIDVTSKQIESIYQDSRNLMVVLELLALTFSVVCAWYLTASITTPLNKAVDVACRVADGDLTTQISASNKDETGQLLTALGEMNGALQRLVGGVRSSTETISAASREIASGNADLSARTESQASSLEETASSMEQLTSTVRQNADNARQANQLAASASEVAVRGGAVVGQVVGIMQSIKDSSSKIVDIISVIDGIAFQTNILALNAAVEAARAGEQGRGFAVVASEVRNLAQRSASAAKEIKELIGDSVEKVDVGNRLVDDAGKTMGEIVASVKSVADIMAEITAASQEQSAGINEVNNAVGQMDQMTQQNVALVEQAAAAAESLQDQAQQLMQEISIFKLSEQHASPPASISNSMALLDACERFYPYE